MKRKDVCILSLGILFFAFTVLSCSRDQIAHENNYSGLSDPTVPLHKKKNNSYVNDDITYSIFDVLNDDLYMDETCEPTDFSQVLSGYLTEIIIDPYFDFNLLDYYLELNRKYVTFYRGDNYYGENEEYNKLAKKRIRELTKFWSLDREIYLNGQHTAFLDDREILTDMIESFDRSVRNRTEAYETSDSLLAINAQSSVFPENPYFAFDAFTKSSGILVIGDGILQSLVETGIDGDIAFSTMLAHEWWHQAQFEYDEKWDFIDQLGNLSEKTKFSELEADFAASYFLSHKRGATYNWKRIEEYFLLSFNVGDCFIQSNNHHGTPKQRLAAAKLGYQLTASAQKKGFILSPTEVHEAFIQVYHINILQNRF